MQPGAALAATSIPPARRIPGNKAIWVGIYCELSEFALMFVVYFIARAHHPDAFRDGPAQLSTLAGVANTLIMLTSSYFVARAVVAMRADRVRACLQWLALALFTGIGYPLVKFFEVRWNLTFNHLVHVFWGLLGVLFVMARTAMGAYSAKNYKGLEAFACYWHTTDLIWLMIFPLFYVLH